MAGAVSLSVKEVDLQETLTLLAERHGYEPPEPTAAFPPWVPDEHPLAEVLSRPASWETASLLSCLQSQRHVQRVHCQCIVA